MLYTILQIVALLCCIYVIYSAWTSNKSTGSKVLWTIFALFFSIITAIVWVIQNKK